MPSLRPGSSTSEAVLSNIRRNPDLKAVLKVLMGIFPPNTLAYTGVNLTAAWFHNFRFAGTMGDLVGHVRRCHNGNVRAGWRTDLSMKTYVFDVKVSENEYVHVCVTAFPEMKTPRDLFSAFKCFEETGPCVILSSERLHVVQPHVLTKK